MNGKECEKTKWENEIRVEQPQYIFVVQSCGNTA